MTIKRFLSVAAALGLVLGASACDNDSLTGLNQNPNSPTDAPSGPVFTNAVQTTAGRYFGSLDYRGTEFIAQHLGEAFYPDEDRYSRLQGPQTTTAFNNTYSRELEDLHKVAVAGIAADAPGLYGPALVMQTWAFGNLTDGWGDVPYSQALQGDSAEGTLSPVYDPQQDIYKGFFTTLTKVSADLDASGSNELGGADPIYGGDPEAWEKFANSLHARFALRVVNVDKALADAELKAAFTAPGGLIEDNADNAQLAWPGDGVFDNPWADNFKSRDDQRMSRTLVNIMLANQDPRLPIYAQPTQADTTKYAGMQNGVDDATANSYARIASRAGDIFYADHGGLSYPSYLMTASEVLFIKAEAAERGLGGLTPAQAKGFYDDAITASLEQWGVTDAAAISAYLAQPNVAYKGGTNGLVQIAVQKWVSLYTQGMQAWAEWRRTCQPNTLQAGPAAVVDFIPRRLEYSQTEYAVNKENLDAAVSRQGGADTFASRMWWDSKPTAAPTYTAACNDPEHS
jgi:hypothetical protein